MKLQFYFFFIFGILVSSCSSEKFDHPNNANTLLTNNYSKTWKLAKRYNDSYRMNMGDCFLLYRVTYNSDGTTIDNNGSNTDCGQSLNVNWSFYTDENGSYIKLKGDQIKSLMHVE